MKSHISATIDRDILTKVDSYRRGVKRSRSQVIELAVERYLREEQPEIADIVTTKGSFVGSFSREDTYAR